MRASSHGPGDRRPSLVTALIAAAVTILALGRVAAHPFVEWDDALNIYQNPHLKTLWYCWRHSIEKFYIPVTYTVWGLLAFVADIFSGTDLGVNPHVFHVANLLFHIVIVIGVLMLLRQLGFGSWPALFGTLIFAVHPLQTETVAWATGLRDILSGGFGIWAIWFYLRRNQDSEQASRRWLNYGVATLLFCGAVLSKPQAVCLPLVVLALELLREPAAWRRWGRYLLPWFVLVLPIVLLTRHVQPVVEANLITPLAVRPLIASDDLLFYFEKLFWPGGLAVDYAHTTQRLMQNGAHVWLWVVVLAIAFGVWFCRRRFQWLAIGAAVFVCALTPVLGLVPFAYQTYSNVANHYVYMAMLGPAIVSAGALQYAVQRRGYVPLVAGAVAGLIVVLMSVATCIEAGYWRDDCTLFRRNLQLQPESFVANAHVGTCYRREGDLQQAVVLYRHALTIKPRDGETRFDLANLLTRQGRYAEAVAEYRQALYEFPKPADVHTNLGVALISEGQIDQGMEELKTAEQLRPGNPKALMELGVLSLQRQEISAAKDYFTRALAADPNFAPARAMLQQIEQFQRSHPPQ